MTQPMPASVKIAVVALAVVLAALVGLSGLVLAYHRPLPVQLPVAIALVALLAWSIVRRRRLGWLWGRFLGFFLLAATVLGVVAQRQRPPLDAFAGVVGVIVLPFLVVSFAFGRPGAHRWFGLVCPSCGAVSTRGDLFMRKVRCPACGQEH